MPRLTLHQLQARKQEKRKISMLALYDASFARVASAAGVDILFIGDSLGMVIKGNENTLKVNTEEIAYHTACVATGNINSLVMADLPFMSYYSPDVAAQHAKNLIQAGAEIIKIEGGAWLAETIAFLTERGIPVCAHLGLTPQFIHILGGFKIQGRGQDQAQVLRDSAKILEEAGAKLIVLECVPYLLAKDITDALSIPVIGIGAGPFCDGQVLVVYDILGLSPGKPMKCTKNYLQNTALGIKGAIEEYVHEVQVNLFPTLEHSFE
jgi:3-methyl-2-oxobutanoate hydroxymethyltransferase